MIFFLNVTGCYVIGFAGSDDKVKWLVDELGFDKAYNYKTADWDKSLNEAAPKGVDCYFDNVQQRTLVDCYFLHFNCCTKFTRLEDCCHRRFVIT